MRLILGRIDAGGGRLRNLLGGAALALLSAVFLLPFHSPLQAQLPAEERRQLIEEFEQANRERTAEKRVGADPASAREKEVEDTGLENQRQAMTAARTAFLETPSSENREAVAQTTYEYVGTLIALERFDEALGQLRLTIDSIGKPDPLITQWVDIHLMQSDIALAKNDWYGASSYLEKAFDRASNAKVEGLQAKVAGRLRDFQFEWALKFYLEGNLSEAKSQAEKALLWNLDPGPIHAFLASLTYQQDRYDEARAELTSAMQGPLRKDPSLVFLADIVAKEAYLERDYRRESLDNLVLSYAPGQTVTSRALERAFLDARQDMERTYGLGAQLPVRLSIYPRPDYFRFCAAPSWSCVMSYGKKVRLRQDCLRGGAPILRIMARYAYALWLVDVWTEGKSPAWFQEGLAHQFALPSGPPNGGINEIRLRKDRLLPLRALDAPFIAFPDLADAALVMAQSQSTFQFLLEKVGVSFPGRILEAYRYTGSFEQALREVTGFDYDSLFTSWLDWIDRAFQTNPLIDQSNLRALGTVSPLGTYWEQ